MRIFIISLIICCFTTLVFAQKQWKYKIKIVEHSGKAHRGFFYAAQDQQLIILKNNGDTSIIKAENIDKLFIHRRGIVAPLAIAGALIFFVMAVENPNAIESAVLILVGVPIGTSLGLITGELFANKRFYKKLEAKDFPEIKTDLQRYTQVK